MRVHVVSDVHGNAEGLARAGEGADAVFVLGDLLDFVDYREHGKGIMGRLFGADKVAVFARLRREGTREETVAYARSLWSSLADPAAAVDEAIHEQYAALFAVMSAPTYATPGNVDTPDLWPHYASSDLRMLDGETVEVGGLRVGFVGGGLLPRGVTPRRGGVWRPYLRTQEDFDASIGELSDVDLLCSHIPPDWPELTYDVVARRHETGSATLAGLIRAEQPRWSVFGHVHQPLARRLRVGRTECRNAGHFKRTSRPFVLRW